MWERKPKKVGARPEEELTGGRGGRGSRSLGEPAPPGPSRGGRSDGGSFSGPAGR